MNGSAPKKGDGRMNRLVVHGNLIVDRKVLPDHELVAEGGKIVYVGPKHHEKPDLVKDEGYIAPGYVDIHIHGSHGFDVMDGTPEALQGIAKSLIKYGVTSFLATTLTGDIEHLLKVLQTCKQFARQTSSGAQLVGVHLEGPWINQRYKGAQNEEHIIPPSVADAKRLVEAAGGLLKIVTLAPEHPGSREVIEYLRANGVKASVGHSDAAYESVKEALEHGLSHVTHCYNAMRGFHHREPGVAGAAMYHDELTTELIADGIHVHPVVMSILHRVKSTDRMVLVSDGMRAVGMKDGEYDLGGLRVFMKNGEARLEDGTLAGSTLTLDRAVQNMVQFCNLPIPDAIAMASEIPANVIGLGGRKGCLAVGCDADFLLLDDQLNVEKAFAGGIEYSNLQ
jgi:N-acetylglucosamine-6-phosphate deacetylase